MSENIFPDELGQPVYKNLHIRLATFFGGPLAATWLIAANFKQLGQNEKIKSSWIWGIFAFIVVMAITFVIPESWHTGYIIPLICVGIASLIAERLQGERIQQHILDGGKIYSVWRALGIGMICLVITVVLIIMILLIQDSMTQNV